MEVNVSDTAILSLRDIGIHFGEFRALQGINLDLYPGEVHALLGENGAGKSTLIKVITGVYQKSQGQILLDGEPCQPQSPADAQSLGISTVYQEVNLIPTLSVAKNLSLQRQPRRLGLIDWRAADRQASDLLARLELDIDVSRPLGSYSIAIQQLIAIARALAVDARILILDEPTASLDAHEVEVLFRLLNQLKAQGMTYAILTLKDTAGQVYYALWERLS